MKGFKSYRRHFFYTSSIIHHPSNIINGAATHKAPLRAPLELVPSYIIFISCSSSSVPISFEKPVCISTILPSRSRMKRVGKA